MNYRSIDMIKNYIKVAVRNLLKHKTQSVISILGFALGVMFFVFGFYWYRFETTYDNFYSDSDRIYMVTVESNLSNRKGQVPSVLYDFIQTYCSEAESLVLYYEDSGFDFVYGEELIKSPCFISVDTTFYDVFPQQLLYGTIPVKENEIMINETIVSEYWRKPEDAIGAVIKRVLPSRIIPLGSHEYRITGVFKDVSGHSTLPCNGYIYNEKRKKDIKLADNWLNNNSYIYVKLKPDVDKDDVEKKMSALLKDKQLADQCKLIRLNETRFILSAESSFSYTSISLFLCAALLLISCVILNYGMLYNALMMKRIKEMRLRKSLGALNTDLLVQSIIDLFISLGLSVVVCGCFVEVFVTLFEQIFMIEIIRSTLWTYFVVFVITISFIQAIVIYSFAFLFVFRKKHSVTSFVLNKKSRLIRRVGLIIQLIACVFFLSVTYLLNRQLVYIQQTDLGFETENIIEICINPFAENSTSFLDEITQLPMIENRTVSSLPFLHNESFSTNLLLEWEGKAKDIDVEGFVVIELSEKGDSIFDFRLKDGRMFTEQDWLTSENRQKDVLGNSILNKVLINESAAKVMGFEHPVGQIVRIPFGLFEAGKPKSYYCDYEIIGVVRDYYYCGMKQRIGPNIIMQNSRFMQSFHYLKVMKGTELECLAAIDRIAQKHKWAYDKRNTSPILLKDKFNDLNKSEISSFRLFFALTVVTLIVSLIGLYAITMTALEHRRKEIAIRKIMGGGVFTIIVMFVREYFLVILYAVIIGFPSSFIVAQRWLEQYVYRITIEIKDFVFLFVVITLLVFLTVLRIVIRAASQNPADVIKSE